MEKKNKRRQLWIAIPVVLLLLAAAMWIGLRDYLIYEARMPKVRYTPGTWIELAPEGIVSADGNPVYTEMRLGSENKVVVFFYGGGVSVNEFTAARPFTGAWSVVDENGFYQENIDGMIPDYCEMGLGSEQRDNPFRNWTMILIPYTTGDFHIGTADYEYTTPDGRRQVLHHHGYTNYRSIMDEAMKYIDAAPEELLIAGYSAGGFGAAILAGDVMENYFPDAGHATVCVDSSLLIYDRWMETAHDVWGVPDELAAVFYTDNPIVDSLSALYETYGESVTYLYIGTVRDGELARYQNFFNTGNYSVSNGNGWMFRADLRAMVWQLKQQVPTIGIYLIDGLPFSNRPNQFLLTQHTVLITKMMYWRLTDWVTPAFWLASAVNGDVRDHGMNYLR